MPSKTDLWNRTRAKLKKRFFAAGITDCELRIVGGCKLRNYLSFAHRVKRRKLPSWRREPEAHQAELETVVLACVPCHQAIETMPPEEMYRIVTETIEARRRQP